MKILFALAVCSVVCCPMTLAQTAPLRFENVPIDLDSGVLGAPAEGSAVVFSGVVETPGADWIRLWFGPETLLAGDATLIVTSPVSGAVQLLDAATLKQWSDSSAYFAGDRVFVDVMMTAGGSESRVVVASADAGLPPIGSRTICNSVDDRVITHDPRAGRLAPQGCTAWLFDNRSNSFLTADHCGAASGDTVWFNVPLRTSNGGVVPPGPEDQYPVDGSSVQDAGASSLGNDWALFGVFNNSNTGLAPMDAQKDAYMLGLSAPEADGRPITITGYGSTTFPVPDAWYAIEKTHTGTYYSKSGTTIRYRTDTSGGNSGSAVFDEQDQRAIGIHTNGGCNSSSTSSNSGTSIDNAGLRSAVMTARGVAAGPIAAVINPLDDLPKRVSPGGGTSIDLEVLADFTGPAPMPGATLHSNDGSGWISTPATGGAVLSAAFPPTACGSVVRYYFSATGAGGETVVFPPGAPAVTFEAVSSEPWNVIASDDFETDAGWTVENEPGTAGGWERGIPPATDRRGGPNEDADGSGSCWTTGVGLNVDVAGGPTRLVSPVFDLSGAADPYLDVSIWMNSDGSSEKLDVEFSDDGGVSWTVVESLGSTPGWLDATYRIGDYVALSDGFRVRLSVADLGFSDVIEAGVDGFVIRDVSCPDLACGPADIAEPFGVLDLADVQGFLAAFLAGEAAADLAQPRGVLDLADVEAFVGSFAAGCP